MQLVGEGQAAEGHERQERRGQAELEPAPPPLLGGSGLGAGPLDFGGAEPLLHAGQVRGDPLAEGPGVAGPGGRLGGQAVAGQGHQLGVGAAGVEPGPGVGQIGAGGPALGLGRGPAGERGRAGQDLAEDRTQGEDVGPLVHRADLAPGLLRRHVGGRTQHRAGQRQLHVRGAAAARRRNDFLPLGHPARPLVVGDAAQGQHLGQPPIHHLHLAERADHDVRRLQVPVDHPSGVRVGHRLRHLLEDAQGPRQPVGRRQPGSQKLREGLAPDQLHREEWPAVGEGAQLVDRHDARVLELAADLRLLDEAADHLGTAAEVVAEDLDGNVAADVGVAALEHLAHAAAGDLAVDAVADR